MSSSVTSTACTADSRCSGVRGPTIGPVTAGRVSSQARPDGARLLAGLGAEVLVGLELRALGLQRPLDVVAVAPAPVTLLAHDAAEQAAGQRRPRDDPEAVVLGRRQHLELDLARQQVVVRLLADQAHEVAARRRPLRLGDVPAGEVRRADVEDLALGPQHLHGLPDFVPARAPVDVMHLVEVDVVGLQPLQAGVAGPTDVQRRELAVVRPVAHVAVELGGHDHLLAAATALGEPASDDLLGGAPALGAAVDVGRVEKVDSGLQSRVHDGKRGRLIGFGPEIHGAQADAADVEAGAAEVGELHGSEPIGLWPGTPRPEGCGDWPTFSPPRYIENTILHPSEGA